MGVNKRPSVLVTGAAGALARRVIARLHGRYQVIAVDFRQKVETDAGIPSYKVEIHKRGFEEVFRHHRIDAAIHIGRMFAHESDRIRRYNSNVLGTRKLLDLCLKYQVGRVIIHSTHLVYGASPYNPALLDEDWPLKASEVTQDLVDAVELESLANIHLWKHPELNITVLRPVNILGPGVRNTLSMLLSRPVAPVLMGFSPMMQFLHVEDVADALVRAFEKGGSGIFNIAPDDYIAYQLAVRECGCRPLQVPSIPSFVPRAFSSALNWNSFFPPYLLNYFKYPVIVDGRRFREQFDWAPRHSLSEIFSFYRRQKQVGG